MMHTLGFCLFCLFLIFGSTYSTTYSCDSNAPCGCSENSVVANARIVNGEDARRNTWSWAVSLILNSSSLCGGAIIDQSYIVTAAHCIHYGLRPQDIAVHAGSLNIVGGVVIRVSQILVHPYYDSGKHTNDIALLKLDSPLYLSDTDLAKICLPNVVNTSQEYPTPGTSLMTVGWGTLWSHGGISKILQQVTVNAVEADTVYCQKVIKDPSLQLCAGIMPEGGKDTCQGDSGGPLMMFNSDKKWELVGVVSYGVGCARPGLPGVYTRVSSYIEWINTIITRVPPTTTYRTPATTPTTTKKTPTTSDFDFGNSSSSIKISVCFLISVFLFLFYH